MYRQGASGIVLTVILNLTSVIWYNKSMEKEYTFNGQRSGEKVIDLAFSHPYLLYPPGLRSLLILILGIAVVIFFPKFYIVSAVLFLFAAVYFVNAYYGFKESILIITDQRVLYVMQKGFFSRTISEANLPNILNISSETSGLAKTMLKYGDLIIRTAGATEGGDIIVKSISNPYYYQQEITHLIKPGHQA